MLDCELWASCFRHELEGTMKRIAIILAVLASTALASLAQSVTLVFDENGYSSAGFASRIYLDGNGDGVPPAGGISTLDYLYPIGGNNDHVALGWVVVKDPDGAISDLFRFDSSTQVGSSYYQQFFFYSSDIGGDLADNWPSAGVITQILSAANTMTVYEDANGVATYTPTSAAQPGWHLIGSVSSPPYYTYVLISDVPEPGMLSVILASLVLLRFRRTS